MISRYSIGVGFNDLLFALKESLKNPYKIKSLDEFRFSVNGRSALTIILKEYGLKKSEKVIVPLMTCESVHQAIKEAGGIPEFVMPKNNFHPSIFDYSNIINDIKAKYVVVISNWGYPYPINELRKKIPSDTIIIQDCALSYGSFRDGFMDGNFSDSSFFSFSNGKPLFLFGGGMIKKKSNFSQKIVLTKELKIKNCLNILKLYCKSLIVNHPWIFKLFYNYSKKPKVSAKKLFSNETLPWVQNMFYRNKIKTHKEIKKRRSKFNYLVNLLDNSKVHSLDIEPNVDWNYWMVPIIISGETDIDYLCNQMRKEGYDIIQPYKAEIENFKKNHLSKYKFYQPKIVLAPSLDLMTYKMIKKFVNKLHFNIN
tara:strand:- start:418 stop:1521 length:1104 start_codon:yes stop_codon:yes gene_type:complete